MQTEPKTLEVSVSEEIKTKEAPPGTPAKVAQKNEEKLPPAEVEKRQKIMLEYTRLLARYVEPHNKKSRWVKKEDLPRLLADGKDLVAMCNLPRGNYAGIAALAHSQMDIFFPLRFFVMQKGMVIINPVIITHTKTTVEKNEGCMSHPYKPVKTGVPRYNKITVIYQTLERLDDKSEPTISKPITEGFNGSAGHVFSHEVDHCNGQNIYDKNFNPENIGFFGDGPIDEKEIRKLYE